MSRGEQPGLAEKALVECGTPGWDWVSVSPPGLEVSTGQLTGVTHVRVHYPRLLG